MWRMSMNMSVSTWILITAGLWPHRWEQVALSVVIGLAGIFLAPATVVKPRLGTLIYVLGAARSLSVLAFPDSLGSTVDAITTGALLIIGGMFPAMTVGPVVAPAPRGSYVP